MYGFRTVIPMLFGTSSVGWMRFLTFNFLGALLWSILFGSAGYILGTALETYIGNFHRAEKYVLLGLLSGAVIVQVVGWIGRRTAERVEKGNVPAETVRDNREEKA